MSILKNLTNAFMPHLESRRSSATLAAVNAELVHDVNGDESATIFINGTGTLNATYSIQGSPDGVNYGDILCFPYGIMSYRLESLDSKLNAGHVKKSISSLRTNHRNWQVNREIKNHSKCI